MERKSNDIRPYIVKCPICGKDLCRCNSSSDIVLKCRNCNTALKVIRIEGRLMVEEEKAEYVI